jgi:hypothetical protein
LSNGGGGVAAAVASRDGLTEREGNRCWHGKSSRGVEKPGCASQHIPWRRDGTTGCRISRHNLLSHFTAQLDVG